MQHDKDACADSNWRYRKCNSPMYRWMCSAYRREITGHFSKEGIYQNLYKYQRCSFDIRQHSQRLVETVPVEPDQIYGRDQRTKTIHEALDRLPTIFSNVIEWKYIEGLSVKQIAHRLNVSHSAAQSILLRARTEFQLTYDDSKAEIWDISED